MTFMKFPNLLCIVAFFPGAWLQAAPKNVPARQVRFLALGELPPFQQEIRDNVRYELEPPPGSLPPREVMLGFGAEKSEATSLRLGQISAAMKAPAGGGPLVLARREDAKDAEPWLSLARPESGDFLVLLWRDAQKGTWEKVQSLVVPDDAVNAPAGSVRYINISSAPVGVVVGDEKLVLEAGKMFKRTIPTSVEQPFEVQLPDATGSMKRLHAGVILQNPGERSLVLIYIADGAGHRRPLKVKVQRELAPVAPPKP
jgi:hypothetical protein